MHGEMWPTLLVGLPARPRIDRRCDPRAVLYKQGPAATHMAIETMLILPGKQRPDLIVSYPYAIGISGSQSISSIDSITRGLHDNKGYTSSLAGRFKYFLPER